MPCGCAGSTPRGEARTERQARTRQTQSPRRERAARTGGGPGQPGYTWQGPGGRKPPQAG